MWLYKQLLLNLSQQSLYVSEIVVNVDATSSKPNEKPLVKEKPVNAGSKNGVDRKACADGIKLALGSDGADYESKIMKWDTSPVKMDGKFNWLLFMF